MKDEDADRVRSTVLRAVRAVCPGWLTTEVEDLAQTATLKILERSVRRAGEGTEVNATYLWRTAHSVVIDCLRARARRPAPPQANPAPALEAPSGAPGPEAEARRAEIRAALRACLSALLSPRRRAVGLHLIGHSAAEIAQLCGWPAKRADNLLYRGLADLRTCLRSKGHGDDC